jgi:two-component system OmpR family sensor kinase
MTAPSLTRRLIWTLTAAAVVLWLLSALLAANTLRARLNDAFDGGLKETAERILSLAVDSLYDDSNEPHFHERDHEIPPLDQGEGEYIVYQVRGADGSVLLRSHDAPAAAFDVPLVAGFANSGPWRDDTVGDRPGEAFVQVAANEAHRSDSLWSSILALLWPIALLVPLSALGIYAAVRSGLRPVRLFSARISERHATNLTPVSAEGLPSELQPIARAVNGLIGRVSTALEAERAFASNSAHELRTPIAGSLAQTQRLLAELADTPARDRALQIEASLLRLKHLSEKLLQLARAEAGLGASGEAVDLLPALNVVVDDFQRGLPAGRVLTYEVAPGADLRAPMDVDAFGIAVRNLLENALRYGAADEPLTITAASKAITVSNGGPGVPADKLAHLTDRFVRASDQAQGAGLGLAIVDSLVRQSGGRLELNSPIPGRTDGFAARIVLPAEAG